jgi:hypothetical protein
MRQLARLQQDCAHESTRVPVCTRARHTGTGARVGPHVAQDRTGRWVACWCSVHTIVDHVGIINDNLVGNVTTGGDFCLDLVTGGMLEVPCVRARIVGGCCCCPSPCVPSTPRAARAWLALKELTWAAFALAVRARAPSARKPLAFRVHALGGVLCPGEGVVWRQRACPATVYDVQVWAAPLALGRVAVTLFNRSPAPDSITASWEVLGLAPSASFDVFDVWAGASRGVFSGQVRVCVSAALSCSVVSAPHASQALHTSLRGLRSHGCVSAIRGPWCTLKAVRSGLPFPWVCCYPPAVCPCSLQFTSQVPSLGVVYVILTPA